ncbi:hypothetical protein KKF84_15370 [Myxococcota bacterium]|nr:hypothetical protein [Myxococcota bacterium]
MKISEFVNEYSIGGTGKISPLKREWIRSTTYPLALLNGFISVGSVPFAAGFEEWSNGSGI